MESVKVYRKAGHHCRIGTIPACEAFAVYLETKAFRSNQLYF
jgi:hypothetical protein